jgi:hypothetical protein
MHQGVNVGVETVAPGSVFAHGRLVTVSRTVTSISLLNASVFYTDGKKAR